MSRVLSLFATLGLFALAADLHAFGSKQKDEPEPPKEVVAYNKGVKSMKKGDFAKAQKSFEKALEIKEEFAEAHNNLAYCLRKQGKQNFDAALQHYNRALELKPDLAEAYMYRGALFALSGEADKAKADLERLRGLKAELADELARVIETGQEQDGRDIYGMSKPLD
jgi:tetratricopeptide (TPR) repeat protein